jgi:hypothetical protein
MTFSAPTGMNGFVKDGAHEALDEPERRRIRGVAAQSVFAALLFAAANIRKIQTFLKERAALAEGTLCRLPRRRVTKPIGTWQPAVSQVQSASDPDPPLTA